MKLNATFKALSDPTRRHILRMLSEKSLNAGEIADAFDMTKPTISHHLNMLRDAGLIMSERQGQYIYYTLNMTVMQELTHELMNLFGVGEEEDA